MTDLSDDFGTLTEISKAFQQCYLNEKRYSKKFINIINSDNGDYSRYLFFYVNMLLRQGEINLSKQITSTVDPLSSNLLISQLKIWVNDGDYKKIVNVFSCKNPNDLIAEFFFLISRKRMKLFEDLEEISVSFY